MRRSIALVAGLMVLSASPLAAHEGGTAAGLLSGLYHPISGLDHVLAMVAVGIWGAQLGPPAIWVLPVTFPAVMAFGGMLGLLGVPVSDTMKRTRPDAEITGTVDREHLWHAQTPQMFRLGQLRAALEQALAQDILVTDEATAMELAGYHPRVVRGHVDNIKITVPEDLALAEFYLGQRKPS